MWTQWKDQVQYFVSNRFAAAARRSGAGRKHPCPFLRSLRGPAPDPWSQAKAHGERSGQAQGRGSPRGMQPVWKPPGCVTHPFIEMLLDLCAFVFFSDLEEVRIQVV